MSTMLSISTCGNAILRQPDPDQIAPLARHDDEPVFDEPWQAQALGLAIMLSERGLFTPAQWSEALGAEHRRLLAGGAPDTPQTYYEAVAQALELMVGESGTISAESIAERLETWRRAYLNTPHGKPVELAAGLARNR
jgi:nitrile hydratase accessory protein